MLYTGLSYIILTKINGEPGTVTLHERGSPFSTNQYKETT